MLSALVPFALDGRCLFLPEKVRFTRFAVPRLDETRQQGPAAEECIESHLYDKDTTIWERTQLPPPPSTMVRAASTHNGVRAQTECGASVG